MSCSGIKVDTTVLQTVLHFVHNKSAVVAPDFRATTVLLVLLAVWLSVNCTINSLVTLKAHLIRFLSLKRFSSVSYAS